MVAHVFNLCTLEVEGDRGRRIKSSRQPPPIPKVYVWASLHNMTMWGMEHLALHMLGKYCTPVL